MCFSSLKEAENCQELYVAHFFLTFLAFPKWLNMCTSDCCQTFHMVFMLDEHGAFLVFPNILFLKCSNIQKSLNNFTVKIHIPFSPINILLYCTCCPSINLSFLCILKWVLDITTLLVEASLLLKSSIIFNRPKLKNPILKYCEYQHFTWQPSILCPLYFKTDNSFKKFDIDGKGGKGVTWCVTKVTAVLLGDYFGFRKWSGSSYRKVEVLQTGSSNINFDKPSPTLPLMNLEALKKISFPEGKRLLSVLFIFSCHGGPLYAANSAVSF